MQNDMPIVVIWSKPKPEVEFQYGGRLFFEIGNSYLSCRLRYNHRIWFAHNNRHPKKGEVTCCETGSKIVLQQPPS